MAPTPTAGMSQVSDWFKNWIGANEHQPEQPPSNVRSLPRPPGSDITAYGNAALLSELDKLRATGEGSRNDQLNKAAFNMGQLVAGGEAEAHYVADMLAAAARDIGLDPREIMATLRSGMNSGAKEPRAAPPQEPGYTEVIEAPKVDGFWDTRTALIQIREFAYSRMCSPWAVLGVCMLRALAIVPPHVVLPPIIGGEGSLNSFVALVSKSGDGKGSAERAAKSAIEFTGFNIYTAPVGSGEGIAHQYAHRASAAELREGMANSDGIVRDRDSVLFTVHEVDTLTALGNRQGATLLSQLRSAFSGERLGFGYADATRRIPIEEHSYRLGMTVGVQPEKAGGLIYDSDGGTPQRFIWLPANDPDISENPPVTPPPLEVDQQTAWARGFNQFHVLTVPDEVSQTIRRERAKRGRDEGEALDAHSLFAREKIAFALTVLDHRRKMTPEDWELSGVIMTVSDVTRARVQATLEQQIQRADRARAEREAKRTLVVTERLQDAAATRISSRLLKHVPDGGIAWSALRRTLPSRDRDHFDEAVERLVKAGQIKVEEGENGRHIHASG